MVITYINSNVDMFLYIEVQCKSGAIHVKMLVMMKVIMMMKMAMMLLVATMMVLIMVMIKSWCCCWLRGGRGQT